MESRFHAAVEQARKSGDFAFSALLSKEQITASQRDVGVWFWGRISTGTVTIRTLLAQCLSADHW